MEEALLFGVRQILSVVIKSSHGTSKAADLWI